MHLLNYSVLYVIKVYFFNQSLQKIEISYFGNSALKYKAIENVYIEMYKGEPIVKELN